MKQPLHLDRSRLLRESWLGDRWMNYFFLISYKEIYRQAQRCRQIYLPVLPRAPGTPWAVHWVSLCPDVRAVSTQAFLSLSAGLSLNPLCQDWINWAAGHLDCFPSGKESQVVQTHLGGWERVKSNRKTNSLNQRGMRKPGEGRTMTAGQGFHPARLAHAASALWPEGSRSTEHKGLETEWPDQEAQVNCERSSREALMVPSLLSLGSGSLPLEEHMSRARRAAATRKSARWNQPPWPPGLPLGRGFLALWNNKEWVNRQEY